MQNFVEILSQYNFWDSQKRPDLGFVRKKYLQTVRNLEKARQTYHSTAQQAAEIASMAQVGRLIIGHFSATIQDFDNLLAEARSVFPSTDLAFDGMKVEIPFRKTVEQAKR